MILEEKVDRLEEMMMKLTYAQLNTQINIDNLSREIRDFKVHTQVNIDNLSREIRDFKVQTQNIIDDLGKELKNSEVKTRTEMRQRYEELIKKLGTITEDMVIPNIDFIAMKYFNLEKGKIFLRAKAHLNGENREFDALAIYDNYIILVEAKHNPRPEYAVDFINFINSKEFFAYFPEYKEKKLIPVFASFYIPENVLKKLSKNNIYGMGTGDDTMDILNFDDVKL